ncbi:hypothetical protein GGF43_005771 [Coemansia sp. RSA 2618]|nr:hypothetical protein GGF43_005771 [Coemansia sp. RSA 2618]
MASGFVRWKSHVDKLLRFNHMTITLSAEPFRISDSGSQALGRRETAHEHHFAHRSASATATLQYAFDSTLNFPEPFLDDAPQFSTAFEPSLSHLPCVLFLHGSDPGGFDVARWVAGGLSHVHKLRNPLMPSRFGSYSVYNVQERSRLRRAGSDAPQAAHELQSDGQTTRFAVPMPPLGMLSISRPGYLESTPSHTATFSAQAATAAQLVERLRLPSVHVIAHKEAAPIALELAGLAEFRRRVRSITLIDPLLSAPTRAQRLAARLGMFGPEWARTRAAYNALARAADDGVFLQAVSEICGAESINEIGDDPAMAQLYEGIGVFFSHWNARKPGVLADSLMWARLDRRAWRLVSAPLQCITSTSQQFGSAFDADALAREEAARAALVSTGSSPEFVRLFGAGRLLFPLERVCRMCLDFVDRHHGS